MVSTYPPRRCGIASFSKGLVEGLVENGAEVKVVSVVRKDDIPTENPQDVEFLLRQEELEDYRRAATFLNDTVDVVILQHEYGIFGGQDGVMLLELLRHLKVPVITVLHTLLVEPTPSQREILLSLIKGSSRVVIISRSGFDILRNIYRVSLQKVVWIPHGVPARKKGDPLRWRRELQLDGRVSVLTFGLIGPGKGLETALKALKMAIEEAPNLVYIIAGATHPEVFRREGESYRNMLERMVEELGLENHVIWINRYLEEEELLDLIEAVDIYLTPYPGYQQISSGTLTFAAHLGKAIISTPYIYASELLKDGSGILVPFNDPISMAQALSRLAHCQDLRISLRRSIARKTAGWSWTNLAREYLRLAEKVSREGVKSWS